MPTTNSRCTKADVRLSKADEKRLHDATVEFDIRPAKLMRSLAAIQIALPSEISDAQRSALAPRTFIVYDDAAWPRLSKQLRAWSHHYDRTVDALDRIESKMLAQSDAYEEQRARIMRAIGVIERRRVDMLDMIDLLEPADRTPKVARIDFKISEDEMDNLRENACKLEVPMSSLLRAELRLPASIISAAVKSYCYGGERITLLFDRAPLANLLTLIRIDGYRFDEAVHSLNLVAKQEYIPTPNIGPLVKQPADVLAETARESGAVHEQAQLTFEGRLLRLERRAI